MARKRIPGYLVDLADILAAFPGAETFLLVRVNQALEEYRRLAWAQHGLRAAMIPDLVHLGEYHELAGPDPAPPAQRAADRRTGPGRVLPFRG